MEYERTSNYVAPEALGYMQVPQLNVAVLILLVIFFWPGAIIYAIVVHGNINRALAHNASVDAMRARSQTSKPPKTKA